mgnify:FL=1
MLTTEKFNEIVFEKAKLSGITDVSIPQDILLKFALDMHTWGYMSGWRDADEAERNIQEAIKEHGND